MVSGKDGTQILLEVPIGTVVELLESLEES